ncbi:unnamed protein product [Arabidopsis arenosa]|uniref:Uncharacterized protein n=1 Tax=Arabidopsis arenosa TaxID=38785 RepID=A0A8S1ZRJ2_ARAAE|nr:unnamed protein product [Arabidopsis arenosa]
MVSLSIITVRQLFIGPKRHNPFDPDGTIPSSHLRSVEHSILFISFIVYAVFAIVFDRARPRAAATAKALTFLALAAALAQQWFIFYFHSTDHVGVEGQYHLLYQLVIFVSLITTLMGIAMPKSFLVSFVRSSSIACQGAWLILMGFMLFTPSLLTKGCFFYVEKKHQLIRCSSEEALHRAKSLINIEFSLLLVVFTIFIMTFYVVLDGVYGEKAEYYSILTTKDDQVKEDHKNNKILNR